jgi:hypothetical protein
MTSRTQYSHSIEYTINVESRVHNQRRIEDLIPEITPLISHCRISGQREKSRGRVCDVLVHIASIVARYRLVVKFSHKGLAVWRCQFKED